VSQTRDLSGRRERDPFARLTQVLRRRKDVASGWQEWRKAAA